jgi:hypothetical protein
LDETSKVALALFAFHRGRFVAVDQPSLSLRSARVTQCGYNVGGRRCRRLDCAGEWVTSQSTEPDAAQFGALSWPERQSVVIDHDPDSLAFD